MSGGYRSNFNVKGSELQKINSNNPTESFKKMEEKRVEDNVYNVVCPKAI